MLLVECNKPMLACKFHFIFYFYLLKSCNSNYSDLLSIANLAAASIASVNASKAHKFYKS